MPCAHCMVPCAHCGVRIAWGSYKGLGLMDVLDGHMDVLDGHTGMRNDGGLLPRFD